MNEVHLFEDLKQKLNKILKRKIKLFQKKLLQAEEELQKAAAWQQLYHQALLLQANLYRIKEGASTVEIEDWNTPGLSCTFFLNPQLKPYEEVQKRFKASKKLQVGLPYKTAYVNKLEDQMSHWKQAEKTLLEAQSLQELQKLETQFLATDSITVKKKTAEPHSWYRTYQSRKGDFIYVGKSAKENDRLTFQFAHGNDWWLHVADYPGSHVILRTASKREVSPESLQDAMQLALYHSKARTHKEAEVCLTQCKYVKKLGGKAGQVTLSQHRRMKIKEDPQCLKRLLQKDF